MENFRDEHTDDKNVEIKESKSNSGMEQPIYIRWWNTLREYQKRAVGFWKDYSSKRPKEAFIIKWFSRLALLGVSALILIIMLAVFGIFGRIPDYEELKNVETANASETYSSDGILIGKYYIENRTTIELDSLSPYLVTALLAIEDKRFFEHSGIDFWSWLRVFKGVVTGKSSLGGGSTLSQQLAKNLYPRTDFNVPGLSLFINKVKENIISIRLEKIYNKEELLIMYLNTVPFGGNRYGIQEAARYFYGKRPRELNPDQAATLIGMLKATTALNPTRNPENSKNRRNLVLAQMLKNKDFRFKSDEMKTISRMIYNGAITEEEYQILVEKPIDAEIHEPITSSDGIGTYYREFLRTKELPKILDKLKKADGGEYNLYTDGLKIYTSLDSRIQKHAEEAVYKHMSFIQNEFYKHWKGEKKEKPWGDDKWIDDQVKRSERYKHLKAREFSDEDIDSIFQEPVHMIVFAWEDHPIQKDTMLSPLDSVRYYFTLLNTGFMAMDHGNGYIKAWVGGIDFMYFKYDHILSNRQVGSTFKPVVYTAAVEEGIEPCDFFENRQVSVGDWSPKNANNSYGGFYTMTGGLTYSVNSIVAQLIQRVGIQKTIDLSRKFGITAQLPREFGISLGAVEIPLYEMMKVYATIANRGYKTEPVAVLKIEDRYGKVIYDYEANVANKKKEIVVDSVSAYKVSRMLQNAVIYGTASRFRSQYCTHCDFAGKTGTTQNQADGWFIGFNPELVTGVWVGGVSRAVRFRSMVYGQGAALALPIVGHFWYNMSIDANFAKMTQKQFKRDEKVIAEMNCPLRIDFSPQLYYDIMRDSMIRDSMIRTGFKGLQDIAEEMFPESFYDENETEEDSEIIEKKIKEEVETEVESE